MTFVSAILRHFSGWQGAVKRHRHSMATNRNAASAEKGQKRATNSDTPPSVAWGILKRPETFIIDVAFFMSIKS